MNGSVYISYSMPVLSLYAFYVGAYNLFLWSIREKLRHQFEKKYIQGALHKVWDLRRLIYSWTRFMWGDARLWWTRVVIGKSLGAWGAVIAMFCMWEISKLEIVFSKDSYNNASYIICFSYDVFLISLPLRVGVCILIFNLGMLVSIAVVRRPHQCIWLSWNTCFYSPELPDNMCCEEAVATWRGCMQVSWPTAIREALTFWVIKFNWFTFLIIMTMLRFMSYFILNELFLILRI